MDDKKLELEALLAQQESNLTDIGKERIEQLRQEVSENEEYK